MSLRDAFYHEHLLRGASTMRRLHEARISVCGAGALGANITENLARQGCGKLRVIDRDRIEERNLSTQPYYASDVGAFKAKILANSLYRALEAVVDARAEELTPGNCAKLLSGSALVIDTFDNSVARKAVAAFCAAVGLPCLHAGLATDYAETIWNETYRVPSDANDDFCDYPLARNLVLLTTAVACEAAVRFIAADVKQSFTITRSDLAVRFLSTP